MSVPLENLNLTSQPPDKPSAGISLDSLNLGTKEAPSKVREYWDATKQAFSDIGSDIKKTVTLENIHAASDLPKVTRMGQRDDPVMNMVRAKMGLKPVSDDIKIHNALVELKEDMEKSGKPTPSVMDRLKETVAAARDKPGVMLGEFANSIIGNPQYLLVPFGETRAAKAAIGAGIGAESTALHQQHLEPKEIAAGAIESGVFSALAGGKKAEVKPEQPHPFEAPPETTIQGRDASKPIFVGKSGLASQDLEAAGRKLLPSDIPKGPYDIQVFRNVQSALTEAGQEHHQALMKGSAAPQEESPMEEWTGHPEDPDFHNKVKTAGSPIDAKYLGELFTQYKNDGYKFYHIDPKDSSDVFEIKSHQELTDELNPSDTVWAVGPSGRALHFPSSEKSDPMWPKTWGEEKEPPKEPSKAEFTSPEAESRYKTQQPQVTYKGSYPELKGPPLDQRPHIFTKAFHDWFRGSKIVDSTGKPMPMVHGTNKTFEAFKPGTAGAIFFSPSHKFSEGFGDTIQSFYLKARRPWDYQNVKDVEKLAGYVGLKPGSYEYNRLARGDWTLIEEGKIQKALVGLGYDSFHVWENGEKNTAVYHPTQIKALENKGEFRKKDPRYKATTPYEHDTGDKNWSGLAIAVMSRPEIWESFRQAAASHEAVPIHTVLKALLDAYKANTPQRDLINALLNHVPNDSIHFVDEVRIKETGEVMHGWDASYHGGTGDIQLKWNVYDPFVNLMHELVHAVTYRFVLRNPDHPLSMYIENLRGIAEQRVRKMYGDAAVNNTLAFYRTGKELNPKLKIHRDLYGLTDSAEYLAEALTHRGFQNILAASEVFKQGGEKFAANGRAMYLKAIVKKISSWLGLAQPHEELLMHTMVTASEIMRKQAEHAQAFKDAATFKDKGAASEQAKVAENKVKKAWGEVLRIVNPESISKVSERAGALLAAGIARVQREYNREVESSKPRHEYWQKAGEEKSMDFIFHVDEGKKFDDVALQAAADMYRKMSEDIYQDEKKAGFTYDAVDHYIQHLFEPKDEKAIEDWGRQKYGTKFGDPAFIKDRKFQFIREAVEHGFKLKYPNPEDIMIARKHASEIAIMKINLLRDLEKYGSAVRITATETPQGIKHTPQPKDYPSRRWRAPNGETYWVHEHADAVLHNHFETGGFWSDPTVIRGSVYRGLMGLKNRFVPIRLASFFHALHVGLVVNTAAAFPRAVKSIIGGGDIGKALGRLAAAEFPLSGFFYSHEGMNLLKALQGKDVKLNAEEEMMANYMTEAGFIPGIPEELRNTYQQAFKDAWREKALSTPFHFIFAIMPSIMKPMFEIWIPALKTTALAREIKTAMEADPSLAENRAKREITLTKLRKNVDDRLGEKSYVTMFMNRYVKDSAVMMTLSLGWQTGFFRQFPGSATDIVQMFREKGSLKEKILAGRMDRPLFVASYIAHALAFGGLMTWFLTGKPPQDTLDYTHPKNGEKNPDGSDQRMNTMFFTREFVSIYKHMKQEGVMTGLKDLALSKGSGIFGMLAEVMTGVDGLGKQIRDPDDPIYKQVLETTAALFADINPIALEAIRKNASASPVKTAALAIAGFSPAARYITESDTQAAIRLTYDRYYGHKETPYIAAQKQADTKRLEQLRTAGKTQEYNQLKAEMQKKYEMTAKEMRRKEKSVGGKEDSYEKMFKGIQDWEIQKRLLDQMPEDERKKYLKFSNKTHLRRHYAPASP